MTPQDPCRNPGPDRSQGPGGRRRLRLFHLSLLLRRRPAGGEDLVATTVVRRRNLLGRAYLAAITPGRVLVTRPTLARA
ncbi:DUF2867 domain-containing protein [Methylobacterium planeticum]|uniref:DUF2867 domain-containing protein n=1 Tax=Methylobacterium planeticum TaxID=2615211 RepID=A0A6N6MNG2_9HYPH|nr:DUF2867 domain-containing protein [Methylobacterium planeticum]KAB1070874.1 DUF2867 domain-containing protein [Methylobacterium planeticum]